MLKKNNREKVLGVFFDDPIPEGGHQLRQISREIRVSPLSVKNYLDELIQEKVLLKKRFRKQPVYVANIEGEYFRVLKKLHTLRALYEAGFVSYVYDSCLPNVIILFGSASRGEDVKGSDIDIFIESSVCKLDLIPFEKKLKRRIIPIFRSSFNKLSKGLCTNILNGVILKGYLSAYGNSKSTA